MSSGLWLAVVIVGILIVLAVVDLTQRHHAVRRNFPVVGRLRYWLEAIGPELRQYIVTGNDSERPFSRDQRRWIYTSAKADNSYFGFGTDNDLETATDYVIVRHAAFPLDPPARATGPGVGPDYALPMAKVLGGARNRPRAFRPTSVVNVSSMSFGALSRNAVIALDQGAALAGCLHGTGEGGITPYHEHGAGLVWQIGTGYFGCRDAAGHFDVARFRDVIARYPQVAAIEIKLSQGAKPGLGGMLPAAKVTPEIAALRGIPEAVDCKSPARHSAFSSTSELLDFVELLASESGLPVGIKSAVGEAAFWDELAALMTSGMRGVDFVVIDGGEGGTGAGPLVFTDHVALPFVSGFALAYSAFARAGISEQLVWIGSGRLGLPERALLAFALGCDGVNVAREAMLSIGCIQAQRCHTGRCPSGVATQSAWLQRGLDPADKSVRAANYLVALRKELLWLSRACGRVHPGLLTLDDIAFSEATFGVRPARPALGYEPGWGLPSEQEQAAITALMS